MGLSVGHRTQLTLYVKHTSCDGSGNYEWRFKCSKARRKRLHTTLRLACMQQFRRARVTECSAVCCFTCAGLPANDQQYFCPANGSSCYFYASSSQTYNASKSLCQGRGGYAVAYNSCATCGYRIGCSVVYRARACTCSAAMSLSAGLRLCCHIQPCHHCRRVQRWLIHCPTGWLRV
jgi:hypothetical protein